MRAHKCDKARRCQKWTGSARVSTCAPMTHLCLRLRRVLTIEKKAVLIEWCGSIEAAMSIETSVDPGVLLRLSTLMLSSVTSSLLLYLP